MWTLLSNCLPRKPQLQPPTIASLFDDASTADDRPNAPRTPFRPLGKPLFLSCSRDDSKITKKPRMMRTSHAIDGSKASFLDLPAELRNNIYSRLGLIVEGYVRVMRLKPTSVPALVLLRTCKQVHDEVASIFYAANSFYCQVARPVIVMKTGVDTYEDISALYAPSPYTDPGVTKNWLPWLAGGIFFPAPQYHVWLTRVTVDATFYLPPLVAGYENITKAQAMVQDRIEERVIHVYERMKSLWQKKDREWEGRLQGGGQRHCTTGALSWTITFAEAEHEETATKAALRRWEASR